MRGDVVYRVSALHEGREKDFFFGAFRSAAEAEAEIEKLRVREMNAAVRWSEPPIITVSRRGRGGPGHLRRRNAI